MNTREGIAVVTTVNRLHELLAILAARFKRHMPDPEYLKDLQQRAIVNGTRAAIDDLLDEGDELARKILKLTEGI